MQENTTDLTEGLLDSPIQLEPISSDQEPKAKNLAPILSAVALLVILGGLIYIFSTQYSTQVTAPSPSAETQPVPDSIAEETQVIPSESSAEWALQTSDLCGVTIPIPPKQEPYYSFSYPDGGATTDNGRFWQFEDQAESPLYLFKKSAMAVFSFESGSSNGYTPGLISVHCADNTDGYTNETLLAAMRADFQENYPESGIKITSAVNNRWGREVLDVRLSYAESDAIDTATIFATPQYIYYVYLKSDSSNPGVVDTANMIFEDLQF